MDGGARDSHDYDRKPRRAPAPQPGPSTARSPETCRKTIVGRRSARQGSQGSPSDEVSQSDANGRRASLTSLPFGRTPSARSQLAFSVRRSRVRLVGVRCALIEGFKDRRRRRWGGLGATMEVAGENIARSAGLTSSTEYEARVMTGSGEWDREPRSCTVWPTPMTLGGSSGKKERSRDEASRVGGNREAEACEGRITLRSADDIAARSTSGYARIPRIESSVR